MKRIFWFIALGWWVESLALFGSLLAVAGCYILALGLKLVPALDAVGRTVNRFSGVEKELSTAIQEPVNAKTTPYLF